jgi:putative exosortase-associated protein (TIGR04073 family)
VKKAIAFFLLALMAGSSAAFADAGATADTVNKNTATGVRNVGAGWVDGMDAIHEEASKGTNMPEHLTGVVAGSAVGARRVIHRAGAGLIDLVTFWIPKKKPLIEPETARLQ